MSMQTEQLIGSRVIEGSGQVVGTVQQIFSDDKDGTPVWARIRAGRRELFVPLGGGRVTDDGLSVPFDAHQILNSPDVSVERHMSPAQTDELRRHYGLTDPAEAGRGEAKPGDTARGEAQRDARNSEAQRGQAQNGEGERGADWLIRTEERVDVGTETLESGRAHLHKYVDTEPVEQTVHVYHEEYEVERVPISAEEQVSGEIAEGDVEVVLHEERPVLLKQVVAVERVRLKVKRVDEDRTLHDEIRRERVEIEPDGGERTPQPAGRG